MGILLLQLACLVLTNAFFLIPAMTCYFKRMWYEASIYTAIIFVSSIYHYADTLNYTYLFDHHGHHYGKFGNLYTLDHYLSYAIIVTTVFLIVHPTNSVVEHSRRNTNKALKAVVNTFMGIIILELTLEDVDTAYLVPEISILCLLYIIFMVVVMKVQITIGLMDFLMGTFFLAISAAMFILSQYYLQFYWIFHSFWHVFISISLALFAESKRDTLDLPKYLSCGKYAVEKCDYDMLGQIEH